MARKAPNKVIGPDARSSPGLAVDAAGAPAADPSPNVLDLVAAEGRRQDDLRVAAERRQDDMRDAAEVLSRTKHEQSRELIRIDALHAGELRNIQVSHAKELREAETKRLDAIRSVDVEAARRATEQSAATATLLASQVQTTAELLRQQFTTTTNSLSDRIAQLERSSYEGSGKSAVVDPMMARMVEAVEALRTNSAKQIGREGLSQPLLMALVAAATGLVVWLIQNGMGG